MLISLISFILVIAICVVSHEGGHFLAAKWRNVYVHEFSFGMGYPLFSKKQGETLYSVRALPIGGYVKLEGEDATGEDNEVSDIPRDRALYSKRPWERVVILAAGVAVNLLLAWILFSFYLFANGSWDTKTATVGKIIENSPAAICGIKSGDVITKINENKITEWADISKNIRNCETDEFIIEAKSNGNIVSFKVTIKSGKNGKLLGVTPRKIKYTLPQSFGSAMKMCVRMSYGIIKSIFAMVTGKQKEEISGPLGIAVMSGQAAKEGFWSFIAFLAIINLNLGLVNLLPFPALDGGRILFTLIEMMTGKKVSPRFEAAVHYAGFIILIAAIIYVTGLDVLRLIRR